MYMRIIWGRTTGNGWASIESNYRELAERSVDGLTARWLIRDVNDSDSFFAITLWRDLAAIEAWESSEEFQKVFLPGIRPFMVGSRSVAVCEVVCERWMDGFPPVALAASPNR